MNKQNLFTILSTFLLLFSVAWSSHARPTFISFEHAIIAPMCSNIAQVSISQNTDGNTVATFQLPAAKSWTEVHFSRMCSRFMPEMQQQGLLLNCTFSPQTQTVTAIFDGDSFAANPTAELNQFFANFGYKNGYTLN